MRGTRTYCSSACSLSCAHVNRHVLHTVSAMGIWASPSRLTYAADNSHQHHQTLDIHAIYATMQKITPSGLPRSGKALCQLQILPHLQQQQQSQQQEQGSRFRLEASRAGREMTRGSLGGVTTHGMTGRRGTKTSGANLSRNSKKI